MVDLIVHSFSVWKVLYEDSLEIENDVKNCIELEIHKQYSILDMMVEFYFGYAVMFLVQKKIDNKDII